MTTVLSVQSRVAAGHVGNSAAVFCLERMGIDVWGVDTLSFSNHAGCGAFKGAVCTAEEVRDILDGIDGCFGLENADAFLSGYLGRAETGGVVLEALEKARRKNPNVLYCCDPVMGDGGRVYVAPDIPDAMREKIVPAADVIAPNRFELELLTRRSVRGIADAVAAARSLLGKGRLRLVLATGLEEGDSISVLSISESETFCVSTPFARFERPLCGTGDILTAVFLGKLLTGDVPTALSFSVSALYGMIRAAQPGGGNAPGLIEAQRELETPSEMFACRRIP